jgi:hypothetical protein
MLVFCKGALYETESKTKTDVKNDIITCKYCSLHIPTKIFSIHKSRCKKNPITLNDPSNEITIECTICNDMIPIIDLNDHETECLQKANNNDTIECYHCNVLINISDIEMHEYKCSFDGALVKMKNDAISLLNSSQLKALQYTNTKQQGKQAESIEQLKKTYQLDDFKYKRLIDRFSSSYIVINFHPDKHLALFNADTHYRSLFETKTSSGCADTVARNLWESAMFNKVYDDCEPSIRCKYGALNLCKGNYVTSASRYGDSYFIMKPDVKYRSTFTYGDSSVYLETYSYQYPESFILSLPPAFINDSLENENLNTHHGRGYIETQIHGDVLFNRDIFALVADDKYRDGKFKDGENGENGENGEDGEDGENNEDREYEMGAYEKILNEFCEKNNILLQWKSNVLA